MIAQSPGQLDRLLGKWHEWHHTKGQIIGEVAWRLSHCLTAAKVHNWTPDSLSWALGGVGSEIGHLTPISNTVITPSLSCLQGLSLTLFEGLRMLHLCSLRQIVISDLVFAPIKKLNGFLCSKFARLNIVARRLPHLKGSVKVRTRCTMGTVNSFYTSMWKATVY